MIESTKLWRVKIEYSGEKIYDLQCATKEKAEQLAVDIFDDTNPEFITSVTSEIFEEK